MITLKKEFFSAIKDRRSIYGISNEKIVPDERIIEIVELAVKHAPSALNSQSGRIVILFGENHTKLWDITTKTLRKIVPVEKFGPTQDKMDSFSRGYATILFFEDQSVIDTLQKNYEIYKDNFPIWSQQSSGMLQFIIWTALELEGFGASLQHYNPLIDEEVKAEWDIPSTWQLVAQMPFGKVTAMPPEKSFQPVEERIKIVY
jgi:uncharacterized protein